MTKNKLCERTGITYGYYNTKNKNAKTYLPHELKTRIYAVEKYNFIVGLLFTV